MFATTADELQALRDVFAVVDPELACPRCQADGDCPQWCVDADAPRLAPVRALRPVELVEVDSRGGEVVDGQAIEVVRADGVRIGHVAGAGRRWSAVAELGPAWAVEGCRTRREAVTVLAERVCGELDAEMRAALGPQPRD